MNHPSGKLGRSTPLPLSGGISNDQSDCLYWATYGSPPYSTYSGRSTNAVWAMPLGADPSNLIRPRSDIAGLITSARSLMSSPVTRSEEHTSELQSQSNLVCRLLLEKKKRRSIRRVDSVS